MLWFALSVLAKTRLRFLRRHVSNWRPLLDAAGVAVVVVRGRAVLSVLVQRSLSPSLFR
jgi:hypothetical protein